MRDRRKKVAYYAGIDPALKAEGSDRLLRHFYLRRTTRTRAGRDPRGRPAALRPGSRRRCDFAYGGVRDPTVSTRRNRPLLGAKTSRESDYRATIEPLSGHRWMRPGEHRPFRVRVRNRGAAMARWTRSQPADQALLSLAESRWCAHRRRRLPITASGAARTREACIAPVIVAAPVNQASMCSSLISCTRASAGSTAIARW